MVADPKRDEEETEGEEQRQGIDGRKRLILLAVLAVAIVVLSVGGTLFVIKMFAPKPVNTEPDEAVVVEPERPKPAIYYPIKPPVVVNYSVRGRQRFLQVEMTLLTREGDVIPALEVHGPMIRNALIMLVGGQDYAELQTAEGKELLRQQCLQELQRLMQAEIGKPGIEQVLFTNFVMQ